MTCPNAPMDDGRCGAEWYALYTRHQHEKTAAWILSNKGLEVFLPLYTVTRRWKDRAKRISLPLFPCYVFLRGPVDRWQPVMTTPGVNSVVGFAGQPAVIPSAEIDAVRQVLAGALRAEPHPFLKCGDRVRVKDGPLEGLEGILVSKKNLFRLILSVELLQRSVAVEVDASMVERVALSRAPIVPRWQPVSLTAHGQKPAITREGGLASALISA